MSTPARIQRSRRRGYRMPADAVSVARPGRWGNPFRVGEHGTVEECVEQYRTWIGAALERDPGLLDSLRGRSLACFCPLDRPCHADVLLELANR